MLDEDLQTWFWGESDATWFRFNMSQSVPTDAARVSLETDNWVNLKSSTTATLHLICECSKYLYAWDGIYLNYI